MSVTAVTGLVLDRPATVLALALSLLLISAFVARGLVKSTSADALVGMDNPARQYKERVAEIFHLRDPLVVAVAAPTPDGIYSKQAMELVARITELMQSVPNIDPDRVDSVATAQVVKGNDLGMEVRDLFAGGDPEAIRAHIHTSPAYQGRLVGRRGDIAIVVAYLLDEDLAGETYQQVLAALDSLDVPPPLTLHVAGDGAVSGYLSAYIDADTARLLPFVLLAMTAVLAAAFRCAVGVAAPLLVAVGTLLLTVAAMTLLGSPFYVMSVGLIVNLVGIAIADSIHILYTLRQTPGVDSAARVQATMRRLWRPLLLTTVTTAAGFLALGLTADMAPMRDFGLYGALGVVIAWLFSVTALPAALTLWGDQLPRLAPARHRSTMLSRVAVGNPALWVTLGAVICAAGSYSLTRITVDDAWIDNFSSTDPIRVADAVINDRSDGVNFLDVYIEAAAVDGLLEPTVLRKIAELELFARSLPRIKGSYSIVELIREMNRAVQGGEPGQYRLPDGADAVAQLLLLYSLSGEPTDLEEEIDYDYRQALVRLSLDSSRYSSNGPVIDSLRSYLKREFNDERVTATLTGRVMVDYEWSSRIAATHATSVVVALSAVFLVCCLVFRSMVKGLLAIFPVIAAVLSVYLTMWALEIYLGMGTAMFAAIAIGLGVDFAIHTLATLERETGDGIETAIRTLHESTGRALLVNTFVVALGFGVLMYSSVPPLGTFGLLIATGIASAFIAAVLVLPAILQIAGSLRGPVQVLR